MDFSTSSARAHFPLAEEKRDLAQSAVAPH
jgi:hypothetical protein